MKCQRSATLSWAAPANFAATLAPAPNSPSKNSNPPRIISGNLRYNSLMLDIQFIRDNPELVAEKSKQKGYDVDVQQLLGFDTERRELLKQVEDLRRQRNEVSSH